VMHLSSIHFKSSHFSTLVETPNFVQVLIPTPCTSGGR
jgi:hypothetical protein